MANRREKRRWAWKRPKHAPTRPISYPLNVWNGWAILRQTNYIGQVFVVSLETMSYVARRSKPVLIIGWTFMSAIGGPPNKKKHVYNATLLLHLTKQIMRETEIHCTILLELNWSPTPVRYNIVNFMYIMISTDFTTLVSLHTTYKSFAFY